MKPIKNLGIWMDHSNAHIMEFITGPAETQIIESDFVYEAKEQALGNSENAMHNKEQHQQTEYYKKLGEIIKHYDDVLLFGPTDAKLELFNMLKEDHLFGKVKIEVKQADKMTENQRHAFVKDYFSAS
jgi:hypothetical protein